jgi:hypothetical protein
MGSNKEIKKEKKTTTPKKISKKKFLKELKDFTNLEKDEKKEIFNLAWDSRKFEIELYWKRAGYFWAFQALTMAGYFAIVSATDFDEKLHLQFYAICLGFITGLGWFLINKGSKSWQRHWEKIIDILEDEVIGKLYKTNTTPKTYSVSKINELISGFFTLLWATILIIQFLEFHFRFNFESKIDWKILSPLIITLLIVYQMFFGRGRGRFGERTVQLYRRKLKVN